jgi:hypothetical protein
MSRESSLKTKQLVNWQISQMPKIHHGDEMGRNDVNLLSSISTDGDTWGGNP